MNGLLDRFTKISSISLYGKRWYQKTYGNTYHSVGIFVNNKLVHKIDCCYGYGDQYLYNAFLWLNKNYSSKITYPLGRYCRENNIDFVNVVVDVSRKKDL